MKTKLQARRERVYEFYLANRAHGKKYTLDHFKKENIPRMTIHRIVKLLSMILDTRESKEAVESPKL